ncbi:MAG: hypothetical protein NTY15_20045 [Planctomycetota bacterium]|nr:hypothetical protein [Planctomycetota bacterium]
MASVDVNSRSPQQPIFWNHLVSWIRAIPRAAILSMVGPSLLCVIGYFGWLNYGAHNLDMAYYGLKKENIHITPQPPWLKETKVLDEVFQKNALSRLSLMDVKTPETLVRVFDAHHAVYKTHRVEKMAGGVMVTIEYRMPVAMVQIPVTDDTGQTKAGFFPIDKESVLLASNNFSDVRQFIFIRASGDSPFTSEREGRPFGDPRIEEAARLCSLLAPLREACKIESVNVYGSMATGKAKWVLEIQTAEPKRGFKWGSCPLPGKEAVGEPPAAVKLERFKAAVSESTQTKDLIDLTTGQVAR